MKLFYQVPVVVTFILPLLATASMIPRQLLGIIPTGILPTGILPTGILPTSVVPTSVVPTGTVSTGGDPTGVVPTGIIPTDVLPTGTDLPLPTGVVGGGTTGDCNTGSIQCCSSVQSSSITGLSELAGLLGIALPDLTALVGLTCSPLNVLGIGGTSCSAQPACCTGNTFSGLITLGCTPLNLNL